MYTALNNSSMKTVVETFVIEETQELIYDNEKLDQWNKHVVELGLKGQAHIVQPDRSPIPFLHMKETLVNVFEVLCPRHVPIADYDKTPIPVEILDLVALSQREGYFSKIEVWYDEQTPDPAVIGWRLMDRYKDNKDSWWAGYYDRYLIGRWADVKQSLEELTAKAKTLFIKMKKDEYALQIKQAQRNLEDLEIQANQSLGYTE